MPVALSKMQLRVQVLNLLSKYRNDKKPFSEDIAFDIKILKQIEDKKYLAKLLFKEIATDETDSFVNVCAIMLLEAIDKNTFEECAINVLEDKKCGDKKKFLVISLIKQKGIYFNYDDIKNYLDDFESVANVGIKNFLMSVIYDPEAQIDLIDFYLNIPKNERLYFINNILNEKNPDIIAFSISLILQLDIEEDEFKTIKETLFDLDSPYLINGTEYILKNYKINLKERQKFKNKLDILKKNYKDFSNDAIIKDTFIYDSCISFIDGNSNFSLILARKTQDNGINAILLTINTKQGIVACMGFGNIPVSGYRTIKRRLFTDSCPIRINPISLKALYKHYRNKNNRTKTKPPYELIVWEQLISDIPNINYDISEFLNSKLDTLNLTEKRVQTFLSSKVADSWYWMEGQNETIDKIIDEIELKHITDYKTITELINTCIETDFLKNSEFMTEIKDRLLLVAYICHLANLKISSKTAYSLCFKNPYFKMFTECLIDKSIYEYFVNVYEENIKQSANSIFKRGKKSNFNNEELSKLMKEIEEKWAIV